MNEKFYGIEVLNQDGSKQDLKEYEGKVLPIEIKSGKDYERHRAITNILEIKNYNIDYGIVFYNGNYIKKDKIDYFPIYLLEFLRNN